MQNLFRKKQGNIICRIMGDIRIFQDRLDEDISRKGRRITDSQAAIKQLQGSKGNAC